MSFSLLLAGYRRKGSQVLVGQQRSRPSICAALVLSIKEQSLIVLYPPHKGITASNLMHLRSLMKFRAETQFFSGRCPKRLSQSA